MSETPTDPGLRGRLAEKARRAGDFEHWPAFYKSFLRLAEADSPHRRRSRWTCDRQRAVRRRAP